MTSASSLPHPWGDTVTLVLVDAHSKWFDVVMMPLLQLLSSSGSLMIYCRKSSRTPDLLSWVTIAGTLWCPTTLSISYHLSGRACRAIVQAALKRVKVQEHLSKFLLKYRLIPHTTTGVSPVERLMRRKPRSRLHGSTSS